jgi:hypothetical protein
MLYLFSKPCHLKDVDVAYFTRLKQDNMREVTERKKERWMKTRLSIEGRRIQCGAPHSSPYICTSKTISTPIFDSQSYAVAADDANFMGCYTVSAGR